MTLAWCYGDTSRIDHRNLLGVAVELQYLICALAHMPFFIEFKTTPEHDQFVIVETCGVLLARLQLQLRLRQEFL